MNSRQEYELYKLLLLAFDGIIREVQLSRLNSLLTEYPYLRKKYWEFVVVYENLSSLNGLNLGNVQTEQDNSESNLKEIPLNEDPLWIEMSRFEKMAPPIEIPKEESQRELIQKVVYEKNPRRINKFNLYSTLLAAAALFLVVIYLQYAPHSEVVDIASLTDCIDVKWADTAMSYKSGDRILSNKSLSLSKGLVQIQTDRGVAVTIEGPAEFQFLPNADMQLDYGRLYANVTSRGIGFSVNTKNSKIIDLGTEFGVQAGIDGKVELHVIKGRTTLIAGDSKDLKSSQIILAGQARLVSEKGKQVSEIPLRRNSFVRLIDSDLNQVWRGQAVLSLADIVGGGDGFGSGRLDYGIDPKTGQAKSMYDNIENRHLSASNDYQSVPEYPFVDGVFVPDSVHGEQVVTSSGHSFTDFPETKGFYWVGIMNGSASDFMGSRSDPRRVGGPGLSLNGHAYGTAKDPSIFIHSSQGITFDLTAIRNAMDGDVVIKRFESICGISETAPYIGVANFYVLVDGQVRFTAKDMKKGQFDKINIVLTESDRFLTCVTTLSGQSDLSDDVPDAGNWCLFGNPSLILDIQ